MAHRGLPEAAIEFFRAMGKKGGRLGGKVAARRMTAEERHERAKKAAAASAKVRSAKARAKRATAKATKKKGA